jgi:cell division septum initiation protein DivIVA
MLVDRLEAVINSGRRLPMSNIVGIDGREALDVLDLMRTAIPEEIKQARRITQDREKILAQAQTESTRILTQSQERVERMMTEDHVRLLAEQRANEILAAARRDAEEIRSGADQYALQMLDRLDAELHRIRTSVRNALNALQAQPPPEHPDDADLA